MAHAQVTMRWKILLGVDFLDRFHLGSNDWLFPSVQSLAEGTQLVVLVQFRVV